MKIFENSFYKLTLFYHSKKEEKVFREKPIKLISKIFKD